MFLESNANFSVINCFTILILNDFYINKTFFQQQALRSVLQATKSSNDLPVGDDYDFYSTFRSVRDVMDIEGRRILSM